MLKRSLSTATILTVLAGLAACSSRGTIESDMGVAGAPDWVNKGTQAVDNDGRYIQGVAYAPPLNDQSLQTSTADSRARAEVARVVSSYVDSTLSDYSSSAGDSSASSIEQTLISSTRTALNGVKIKARWKDSNTGNVYSFAEMDMEALDDSIRTASKLSENFKAFYTSNTNVNFERFVQGQE
ncbi:MAG: LPP20 lipoprotein [Marinobacter excellens HL-55]|uniref:LPP20 lipoprotein n=1 Tax=Marinobacter excellens HL-55 TaxID=1305731 RepID=A0A0P8B1C7_9GAMM|nr:MAG: LPP20 lipoprotein [Marinobacter excellens HL-55]